MKRVIMIIIGFVTVILLIILGGLIQIHIDNKEFEKEEEEALSKISYKIPKKFKEESYSYLKNYTYYDKNASCTFKVNSYENYNEYVDGKDYLEDRIFITLKDKISEIKEIKLNNYKWYSFSVENNNRITNYYATIKEDRAYEIEYEIYDYSKGEVENNYCTQQKDEIIATVKLK